MSGGPTTDHVCDHRTTAAVVNAVITELAVIIVVVEDIGGGSFLSAVSYS